MIEDLAGSCGFEGKITQAQARAAAKTTASTNVHIYTVLAASKDAGGCRQEKYANGGGQTVLPQGYLSEITVELG